MKSFLKRFVKNILTALITMFSVTVPIVVVIGAGVKSVIIVIGLDLIAIILKSLINDSMDFSLPKETTDTVVYKTKDENPYKNYFEKESQSKAVDMLLGLLNQKGYKTPSIQPDAYGRLSLGYFTEDGEFVKLCNVTLPAEEVEVDSQEWDVIMSKVIEDVEKVCADAETKDESKEQEK